MTEALILPQDEHAALERVRVLARSWAALRGDDTAAETDRHLGLLILGMLHDAENAPGGPGARLEAVQSLAEAWERPGGGLFYPVAGRAVQDALRGGSTDVEAGWRERAEAAERKLADLAAALRNALEGLEEMLPYVPEYFQYKWDLGAYVTRAKSALTIIGSEEKGDDGYDRDFAGPVL